MGDESETGRYISSWLAVVPPILVTLPRARNLVPMKAGWPFAWEFEKIRTDLGENVTRSY